MTTPTPPAPAFGDPITVPFWEGASRRELLLQRCADCGAYQFYPRPFCLACQSDRLAWVPTAGTGTIYSMTTVHVQIAPQFTPPYIVAVVQLDEGPRLTTHIVGPDPGALPAARIGDRVRLTWRERDDAPPLPIFTPT